MAERIVPSSVQSFAREHRIDLSKVTAAYDAGKVTFLDLSDYARAKSDGELMALALIEQFKENKAGFDASARLRNGGSSQLGYPSEDARRPIAARFDVERHPVNAMARNPLVERVRAAAAATRTAVPSGSAPTLFVTGDTPAFCASGIPPEAVLTVPWQARHAMAAAPTAAEAYAIQVECAGPDASQTATMLYGNHPGNEDYADRVQGWRIESMPTGQLEVCGESGARDELSRREATMSLDLPPEDQAKVAQISQYGR